MQRDVLTPSEAGRLLNLSASGVRAAAADGRLAVAARSQGGIRLFNVAEVLRFKAERDAQRMERDRG